MLHQKAATSGTQLHLAGAEHDAVRRVLRVTGLDQFLTLDPTADAVIARHRGWPERGTGRPPPTRSRGTLLPPGQKAKPSDPTTAAAHKIIMDQDYLSRRHPQGLRGLTNRGILASFQWQDVEIAMDTARRCFEAWLQAGYEEAAAIRHTHDTQKALQEAARAITRLIETVRAESTALVTGPEGVRRRSKRG